MVLKIGRPGTGGYTIGNNTDFLLPEGVVVNTATIGVWTASVGAHLSVYGTLLGETGILFGSMLETPLGMYLNVGEHGTVGGYLTDGISISLDKVNITNHGVISGATKAISSSSNYTTNIINTGEIIGGDQAINFSYGTRSIVNSGSIIGYEDDAINLVSSAVTLNNSGTIKSYGDYAIYSNAGTLKLVNSGLITTSDPSESAIYAASGATITITNTGTISSTAGKSFYGDTAIDKVYNKGLMKGDIDLHTNNDRYDGTGGRVIGTVFGSSGDDTLIGGSLADNLNGGVNNDFIYGRGGKDVLTGGTGIDKFYFDTAPNTTLNRDTVTDFAAVDDSIYLKKSAFAGIVQAAGVLQAQYFWEAANGLAHDTSDRIIVNTTNGVVTYDSNGNAAGGVIQQIALLTGVGTTLTNADFFVF